MQFLIMFSPWIAYAIASKVAGWTTALALALTLAVVLAVRDRRSGREIDAIKAGGILFFTAFLVASLAGAPDSLARVTQVLSHGWVAILMWTSVAVHRPFTTAAARQEAPREVWDLPFFAELNRRISIIWATSFTVATAVMFAVEPLHRGGLLAILQALSIVVPVVLMRPHIEASERAGNAIMARHAAGGSAEPADAESSNAESSNAESSNAESSNAESSNAESSNAESSNGVARPAAA